MCLGKGGSPALSVNVYDFVVFLIANVMLEGSYIDPEAVAKFMFVDSDMFVRTQPDFTTTTPDFIVASDIYLVPSARMMLPATGLVIVPALLLSVLYFEGFIEPNISQLLKVTVVKLFI